MSNIYLKSLIDIFFPKLCFFCGKKIKTSYLCPECKAKIKEFPQNQTIICAQCTKNNPHYKQIIAAAAYNEPLITLIHEFKYKHCVYLASFLADILIDKLKTYDCRGYDLITSVPMHKSKLKQRGYNQSALLGKKVANYFKIPFRDDIIYERRRRPSQTKLNRKERAANSLGAFEVKQDMRGKMIILVDDIFTTGSTIDSCARELKSKNAAGVLAVTLAKRIQ